MFNSNFYLCGYNMKKGICMYFDFSNNSIKLTRRYEYKILTQKDRLFSGKFDPTNLEHAINAYAEQGWRVISCTTADISGLGKKRQEFVAVLEREVK